MFKKNSVCAAADLLYVIESLLSSSLDKKKKKKSSDKLRLSSAPPVVLWLSIIGNSLNRHSPQITLQWRETKATDHMPKQKVSPGWSCWLFVCLLRLMCNIVKDSQELVPRGGKVFFIFRNCLSCSLTFLNTCNICTPCCHMLFVKRFFRFFRKSPWISMKMLPQLLNVKICVYLDFFVFRRWRIQPQNIHTLSRLCPYNSPGFCFGSLWLFPPNLSVWHFPKKKIKNRGTHGLYCKCWHY